MLTLLHKAARLWRTNIDGPVEFVINEFDCLLWLQAALVFRGLFICGFAYSRSKTAFFKEPILQFQPYIGLFIREVVIGGPRFQQRIYLE